MRRARTRRERRAREAQSERRRRVWATLAITGLVAVFLAFPGILIWRAVSGPAIVYDDRGCSPDRLPRHVVLVLDQTDELPPPWQALVRQLAPTIASSADFPTFGRLTIVGLNDNVDAPLTEILSECRPPEPRASSLLFDTRDEREARQERFDGFFDQRIQGALSRAGATASREASPLLEAMVALQDLLLDRPAARTDVIFLSDMMQYTRNLSHYGDYPSHQSFAATRRGARLQSVLPLDSLTIYYVRRPRLASRQDALHQDFWNDYFEDAGAADVRWVSQPRDALRELG